MPGRAQLVLGALISGLLALPAQASESVQVRGGEHGDGFARIAVEWAAPVAFDTQLSGDTLTIHFARPFTASLGGLPSQLQHYVSRAAQSADGTSIVATLTRPVEIKTATVNGTVAAIDLIARPAISAKAPETKAPSPQQDAKLAEPPKPESSPTRTASTPAPIDVVVPSIGAPVDLLQAVRTAGAVDQLPSAAPARPATPAPSAAPAASSRAAETIQVRGAEHGDGHARIAVEWHTPITFTAKVSGSTLTIHFARPFDGQIAPLIGQLPEYVAGVEPSPDRTSIIVTSVSYTHLTLPTILRV